MGNTIIPYENKIVNITFNTNSSVTGSAFATICGRIGTMSGTIRYPNAGTGLVLAAMPDNMSKYAPSNTVNLSCDFYTTGAGAEAFLNSAGQILVNQPVGGVDLKLSGSWVIEGDL